MTYSLLRKRLAKLIPELSDEQLRLALPAAIGATTGLGALAYNAVAPLDVDPIGLAVGSGLALGTQGRTPYNYAGIAALGLEGARYLNNAFTNSNDTEASPLIAMGIGAGALGLREGLKRGWVRPEDVGFPTERIAVDTQNVTAAPPRKPPTTPTTPTPKPRSVDKYDEVLQRIQNVDNAITQTRVATKSDEVPVNPSTDLPSMVVPSPTIEDYIAKSPLLNRERAMSYANPDSPDYKPAFVRMLSQDLSDDFRSRLAFPEDVLAETYRGTGIPGPVVTGSTYLPILMGSFDGERYRNKLKSDLLVMRPSTLTGGEGKSDLVNRGIVPEGTFYPNIVTSPVSSLARMAQGDILEPGLDPAYFIRTPTGSYKQVLNPTPVDVAEKQYNTLINTGRMAVPMKYKNLSEPQLWIDEVGSSPAPYDINDFYGLRAAKRRTTDKKTGNKYYRGVFD